MKPDELTEDAIDYIYSHVDHSLLTAWEYEFVESTQDQWVRNRSLSDRQKEILGKIWDKQP